MVVAYALAAPFYIYKEKPTDYETTILPHSAIFISLLRR